MAMCCSSFLRAVAPPKKILEDQLTLFKLGRAADYAHLINTCNPSPGFSGLPTALLLYCYARRQGSGWVIKMNGNAIEGGFFISQGKKKQHRRRCRRATYMLWPIDDRGCCRHCCRRYIDRRYRRRRRHWCCLCDEAGRSAVGVFKTSGRSKADDMSINPLSICLDLLQCTTLWMMIITKTGLIHCNCILRGIQT